MHRSGDDGFQRHAVVGAHCFGEDVVVDQVDLLEEAEQLSGQTLLVVSRGFAEAKASVGFLNAERSELEREWSVG